MCQSSKKSQPKISNSKSALQDAFDDLSARFIMNCPAEEFQSFERLFFQLEQAHWFYEDFLREQNPSLPGFKLQAFCHQFFELCPLLHSYRTSFDEKYEKFHSYKVRVPVCGAVMLNEALTKVVLVKGWGHRSGWGFPKGKINKDEPEIDCAVREVLEETGFDCREYVRSADDVLTTRVATQTIKLFVARGVPEDTAFETQTRKEISQITWFGLDEIPQNSHFFMVTPFLPLIKSWISKLKKRQQQQTTELHALLGLSPNRENQSPNGNGAKSRRPSKKHLGERVDRQTFGDGASARGWSANEMFATNQRLFGVQTDYSFEKYTTALPHQQHAQVAPARNGPISLMHLLQPATASSPAMPLTTMPSASPPASAEPRAQRTRAARTLTYAQEPVVPDAYTAPASFVRTCTPATPTGFQFDKGEILAALIF